MRSIVIQIFYTLIMRPWLTYFMGVRFERKGKFKDCDQFIIVANHNSHFDTVSILAALPISKLKDTHTVASAAYFGKNKFTILIMKLFFNAILIKPSAPSTIKIMDEQLKKGKSLILFPEGTRGRPGMITDFKKGIAFLLQKNPTVPFIPVYLDGFGRVLPKDKYLPIPLVCKVRFGDHILPDSNDIDVIMEEVKAGIINLKEKDQRDRNQFRFESLRELDPYHK